MLPLLDRNKVFKYIAKVIVFTALYYLAAKCGLFLATLNKNASPIWPASGIAVSILVLFGISYWPAVFLGALLGNLGTALPSVSLLLIALGNCLEAVFAYYLFQSVSNMGNLLLHHARTASLLAIALLPTIVSAGLGTLALINAGVFTWADWQTNFFTWWSGDLLGILLVTPLVLALSQTRKSDFHWRKLQLALLYLLSSVATIYFILSGKVSVTALGIIVAFIFLSAKLPDTLSCLYLALYSLIVTLFWFEKSPLFVRNVDLDIFYLQIYLVLVALTLFVLRDMAGSTRMKTARFVFYLGTALSVVLFSSFYANNREKDDHHFSEMVSEASLILKDRIREYEDALTDGAALFNVLKNDVNHTKWHDYARYQRLEQRLPGISGIGVVRPIATKDLTAYEQRMRREGVESNYSIHFLNKAVAEALSVHYIISYIEPHSPNMPAHGLDLASEEKRKEAADMARDTGQPTLTKQITLVQDHKKRAGFLLYVPVYLRASHLINTVEERRKEFVGWVYSPFVFEEFLGKSVNASLKEVGFSISEGTEFNPDSVLFSTGTSQRTASETVYRTHMELAQTPFSISWHRTKAFRSSQTLAAAWISFFAMLVTLLLTSLMSNLETIQDKAKSLADSLTKKLRENEGRLNEAQEFGRMGSFFRNFETNENYWSKELFRIWEMDSDLPPPSLEKMLAKIHPEDRAKFEDFLRRCAGSRAVQKLDFRIVLKDGTDRFLRAEMLGIFNSQNKCWAMKGTSKDISEVIKTEKLLEEQRQALIYSSKMSSLGEMAAGISHEINNPLAIISGKTSLLIKSVEQGTFKQDKAIADLNKIQDTVFRISKIIKGLKSFSRNADHDQFDKVSIRSVVEDCLDLCKEKFKNHGIDFKVELSVDDVMKCRATQVGQVLLNLLNNAHDVVMERQERWITLSAQVKGDFVEFSVADCGNGISSDVVKKMFQPFFTTKDVGKGTGLGLSISQGIVEEHGGQLWYDDNAEHTTFRFTIPLARVASKLAA